MRWAAVRLGLLVVMLAAMTLVLLKEVLVLREISVRGNENLPAEAVIAASGLEPEQSMLRLNIDTVKYGINALGSHAFEEMQYRWPDAVELILRPRTAMAMARCCGGMAVLDAAGVVMEIAEEAPGCDLIYLSGLHPEEAFPGRILSMGEDQLSACMQLIPALAGQDALAWVSEIDLGDAADVRLILRDGTSVQLGGMEKLTEKIALLKASAQDLGRRGEGGGVLRFSGGCLADYARRENMAES